MLAYVEIITLYVFKKLDILYESKERPAQTKLMTAKLRALLACAESDYAQCEPAWSQLGAVITNFGFPQIF